MSQAQVAALGTDSGKKLITENIALRARITELETALGLSNNNLGVVFRLPTSLSKLLGLLLEVPNVTQSMVRGVGVASDLKVAANRLRHHLDEWSAASGTDFRINIQSKRTLGYWLDEDTKRRVRALVTPQVSEPSVGLVPQNVAA